MEVFPNAPGHILNFRNVMDQVWFQHCIIERMQAGDGYEDWLTLVCSFMKAIEE